MHASLSGSICTAGPALGDQLLPVHYAAGQLPGHTHAHHGHGGNFVAVFQGPLEAFLVGDEHFGFAVVEPEDQLAADPPGIDADDRGAHGHDGPVSQQPFRVVAHGDGDPVARFYAELGQPAGDGRRLAVGFGIGDALVVIDQIVARGERR